MRSRRRDDDSDIADPKIAHAMVHGNPEGTVLARQSLGDLAPLRIAMHHRVGDLQLGDIAVVVAAAAPHRDAAFAAARSAIDELKSIVPIWKKEYSDDGATWIEDHA